MESCCLKGPAHEGSVVEILLELVLDKDDIKENQILIKDKCKYKHKKNHFDKILMVKKNNKK